MGDTDRWSYFEILFQYHGQGEDDDDEVGEEGEGKVCEHDEDKVGEEGEEEVAEDGGGEVANVGEHKSDEVGEDAEGKLSEHGEDKVGEDGQEELVEDGDKVAEVGEHDEDEVDDVGEGGEGDDGVCYEGDGEDDIIGGGVGDGQDDVGGGVGDGQDEFDVSSWIGSDQDASVSEDDFVDVRVHGDEQPQEEYCEGSLFDEVGIGSGCTTPKKHVQAMRLSDSEWEFNSEWESDSCGSIYLSDDSDHETARYGDFGIFSEPISMKEYKWKLGTYFPEIWMFLKRKIWMLPNC
ncbi:hypothetical protein LR48_Vigan10g066500 [Vigna angularis]|uniref:Uncharacterized protein n=1 Tax=Phaseolus angularis TaxID=3914 RepID=A0A0L9VIF2_PHAAN|nr:hypothetical protein LR48_Vigan10g066500 [Vigna angularis]